MPIPLTKKQREELRAGLEAWLEFGERRPTIWTDGKRILIVHEVGHPEGYEWYYFDISELDPDALPSELPDVPEGDEESPWEWVQPWWD